MFYQDHGKAAFWKENRWPNLVEVCSDFYRDQNFIYVSYRVNDYNVNPTVYLDLEKVKNLAGIGVVSMKTYFLTWHILKASSANFLLRSLPVLMMPWTGPGNAGEKLKKEKNRN